MEYYTVKWSESHSVMSNSLWPHGLYNPWNSPGQNTGVSYLSLSPGDFPDPGIEPGSPALQEYSLPTELSGKPMLYSSKNKWTLITHKDMDHLRNKSEKSKSPQINMYYDTLYNVKKIYSFKF